MNVYLGFVSIGNKWYKNRLIYVESIEEAKEKLKSYYEKNYPEIAERRGVEYNIDEPII